MMTIQALKDYGANTQEGVGRCMGNEAFYLRLVGMLASDTHTEQLEKALAEGNLKAAFEAAHALKGVLSNLAITPALQPVSEITEYLRAQTDMDYQPLLSQIRRAMDGLMAIIQG